MAESQPLNKTDIAGQEGGESHGSIRGRLGDGVGEHRREREHRRHREDRHDRPRFDMHRFFQMGPTLLTGSEMSEVARDWLRRMEVVSRKENCQILQTRVSRFKSDKEEVDNAQLKGYSCDVKFTDKELDIIEMAVYGDVIRPGNQCRCRTVAEVLGTYKSKDRLAACKLPYGESSLHQ